MYVHPGFQKFSGGDTPGPPIRREGERQREGAPKPKVPPGPQKSRYATGIQQFSFTSVVVNSGDDWKCSSCSKKVAIKLEKSFFKPRVDPTRDQLWLKSVIIVTQCLAGLRTVFCALSETVLAIEMKLKQKRFFKKWVINYAERLPWWRMCRAATIDQSVRFFQNRFRKNVFFIISISFQFHFSLISLVSVA